MKLRKSVGVALVSLTALAVGGWLYCSYDYQGEIDRLTTEAQKRGLAIDTGHHLSRAEMDGSSPTRLLLAGLASHRELSRYRFDPSDPVEMHRLIASTDPFFGLIKQFATTKGQQFDDWSNSDRAAVTYSPKVLGMRGYVAAVEGDFEKAAEMVMLIHKTSNRALATGIGTLPNLMAIRWSNIICAELAFRNSENAARMNQVVSLINEQPRIDHKATLGEELSAYHAHVDAVDAGVVSYGPPTNSEFSVFDFNLTNRAIGKTRVDVLQAFIDGFDKWNQRDARVTSALTLLGKSFHDEVVSSALHGIAWAKQREIDQDAGDRAIRLTVAAYAARGRTGLAPTVAGLADAGIETIDPWTDKPFELEFAGNRIFVVGIRTDKTRGIVNEPERILEPVR